MNLIGLYRECTDGLEALLWCFTRGLKMTLKISLSQFYAYAFS